MSSCRCMYDMQSGLMHIYYVNNNISILYLNNIISIIIDLKPMSTVSQHCSLPLFPCLRIKGH